MSNLRYFTTEDTKGNVAVKPVNNLCIYPYLSCICCCYHMLINFSVFSIFYMGIQFCVLKFRDNLNSRVVNFASF